MRFAVLSSEVAARFSCHTTNERCWLEGILARASFWVLEAVGLFPRSARWLAILLRYIAAYARHGLQTSACCVSSRESLSAMDRKRPRSPDGNASGSPSARIATYCVVHFSNPWNFAQPIQQSLGIRHTLETDSSITHSPREPGRSRLEPQSVRCG